MAEDIVGRLHPRRKRFETWEVRRPPVDVSAGAQERLYRSSAQGRLFVQALSEVFGTCDDLERLTLDLVRQADHFPPHALAEGTEDSLLYRLQVTRAGVTTTLLLPALDLDAQHASGHPAFVAEGAAQELLRADALLRPL